MRKVRPDIKNCPYTTCGHQAVLIGYDLTDAEPEGSDMGYQVECETCCATGPLCDTEDAAIQEWNAIDRHEPCQIEPALLPCPFCGGPATFDKYESENGTFLALCNGCNISTIQGTKIEVAATWNRRHNNVAL